MLRASKTENEDSDFWPKLLTFVGTIMLVGAIAGSAHHFNRQK